MSGFAAPIELAVGVGILAIGSVLALLSFVAWRREHEPRMVLVATAYLLFALNGLFVSAEPWLVGAAGPSVAELLEHGSGALVLVGLLLFFAAIVRR